MALDMLTLYETAADKFFELAQYQRAFECALLSHSDPPVLQGAWLGLKQQ